MPWFRFSDEPRMTLRFRNGTCELWLANMGDADGWAWVAEKPGDASSRVVLVKNSHMPSLQKALREDGFPVEAGGVAEKVMRAAVRCGRAEELPEDERWRRELLHARAKARRV